VLVLVLVVVVVLALVELAVEELLDELVDQPRCFPFPLSASASEPNSDDEACVQLAAATRAAVKRLR
jgi:hypothetical protein